MSWTPRVGTCTAAHLPLDAEDLCKRAFFCLAYCMKWENIPAKLIINVDEKRAFTLLVGSSASGDILPFQAVWAGKTEKSLPSKDAPGMTEALQRGFHFTFAASEKKTMKEYIEDILIPYVKDIIASDPGLDDDQKAVFYIGVYPVHPGIILIFVPANCMGKVYRKRIQSVGGVFDK
ncbi:hypothetical protein BDP27DRAFT_1384278 [Rhodocollybia butyracea]|uniref:Uncharacterized protein n=1 Tax=Rhodocollybia butyracea TaxID=206335 RepID=A0A9P5PRA2_9AGAR|nr:hypothetical protein BDP27DRAFT_1384278 [Rhodocollybia butyracea]